MQSGPDVFDRDLDPQPRRSLDPRIISIAPYQRLIVNPFPAVVLFIIVIAIVKYALQTGMLVLFPFLAVLILIGPLLVEYHCLDCGATGWLPRYRKHDCPTVIARFQRGERRRFHGPGVKLQLAGWIVLLAVAFAVGLAVLFSR